MIVLDASAAVSLLVDLGNPSAARDRLRPGTETLHAPHLLDVEVGSTLRRAVLHRELSADEAVAALGDLRRLRISRYPHQPFLSRAWDLRDQLTMYDATYVALAEALSCPLLTCDRKLARTRGHEATIELV